MEKTLKHLCKKHGLRTISIMLMTTVKVSPVTVYVHWGTDEDRQCESGSGDTFKEALAAALRQMDAMRPTAIVA